MLLKKELNPYIFISVNNYFLFLFRKIFRKILKLLTKNETINNNCIADLHIKDLQSKLDFRVDSQAAVHPGDQR